MILYVNGDSNSAAAEIDPRFAWPQLLAEKLNFKLHNHALGGASNDRIYRTTKEYFQNKQYTECFVVIGWTSWEREEWLINDKYYQVNSSGIMPLPDQETKNKYKKWICTLEDKIDSNYNKWHTQIAQLHEFFLQKQIPHLFFNALMPLKPQSLSTNWHGCYVDPYENNQSYYWHLIEQGFVPTADNHHLEQANRYWANFLYKKILDENLLKR